MWQRFLTWVKNLFKRTPEEGPGGSYSEKYEDITGENVTATLSNKLAKKVFGDSTMEVAGTTKRADFVRSILAPFFDEDAGFITSQAFGKGGMVVVPVVSGGGVVFTAVNQERVYVSKRSGRNPTAVTLLAETAMIDGDLFRRWMDYDLDPSGLQTIRTVVTDEMGAEVPFASVPAWTDIEPEVSIANTDRLLLGFLTCPTDNRKERRTYGVPITYGADRQVNEYVEHQNIFAREFRLSRMMLGLDAAYWSNKTDVKAQDVRDIGFVHRTVQDSELPFIPIERNRLDGDNDWSVYAPAIRFEAMLGRANYLATQLENTCGLSHGLLSERPQVSYTNRDEVRAVNYDTYCVVRDMRRGLEAMLRDLAYAVDVFAERFGLTPAGGRDSYVLSFDWDLSMIESSQQTYEQLREGRADKVISRAEHRQWIKGGTLEEAKAAIAEIDEEEPGIGALLGNGDGMPFVDGASSDDGQPPVEDHAV